MIFSSFLHQHMSPWITNSTYLDGVPWLEDLGSSRPPVFFAARRAPRWGPKFLILENGTCDHLEWWGSLVRFSNGQSTCQCSWVLRCYDAFYSSLNLKVVVAKLEEVDVHFFCLFRLRPVKTNMNFRCTWWTPMCQFVRINAIPLHVWFPPLLGNPVLREWRVDIWSALERSYGSNAGAKAQIGKKITVNLQCQDVPILKWKLDMCQDLWKSKGH